MAASLTMGKILNEKRTNGKSPPPGLFDLKDKKSVLQHMQRCQEIQSRGQQQLEDNLIFFEAFIVDQFIKTYFKIIEKQEKEEKAKEEAKSKFTSRRSSSGRKPPSSPSAITNKNRKIKLVRKESLLADNSEMLRYKALAEINKPIIKSPKIISKKGTMPNGYVTWNKERTRITFSLSGSPPAKNDYPSTRPWTMKRADTIAGEYTTRLMNEYELENYTRRPFSAPEINGNNSQENPQTKTNRPASCAEGSRRDGCPPIVQNGVLCWGPNNTRCEDREDEEQEDQGDHSNETVESQANSNKPDVKSRPGSMKDLRNSQSKKSLGKVKRKSGGPIPAPPTSARNSADATSTPRRVTPTPTAPRAPPPTPTSTPRRNKK